MSKMLHRGQDLYIIQMDTTGAVKVGRSKDVYRRLKQLQTACPHRLRLILHAPNQGHREHALHRIMRHRGTRTDGEWFEEGALAELPIELYDLITNLDDPDWWEPGTPTRKTPPRQPEPHWFDVLEERGFWG